MNYVHVFARGVNGVVETMSTMVVVEEGQMATVKAVIVLRYRSSG